jgi:hypothetical protein
MGTPVKLNNIAKKWWFWIVVSIITTLFSKIVRDYVLLKRIEAGISDLNNTLKEKLIANLNNGVACFDLNSESKINNPTGENALALVHTLEMCVDDLDIPVYLQPYIPYLRDIYYKMYSKNSTYKQAFEEVVRAYAKREWIWILKV